MVLNISISLISFHYLFDANLSRTLCPAFLSFCRLFRHFLNLWVDHKIIFSTILRAAAQVRAADLKWAPQQSFHVICICPLKGKFLRFVSKILHFIVLWGLFLNCPKAPIVIRRLWTYCIPNTHTIVCYSVMQWFLFKKWWISLVHT